MIRVQDEVAAAVLEREAAALGDDPRAHPCSREPSHIKHSSEPMGVITREHGWLLSPHQHMIDAMTIGHLPIDG